MPDQCAHVGQRLDRHDIGDDERPRQSARPIRAGNEPAPYATRQVQCAAPRNVVQARRDSLSGTAPMIAGAISSTPAGQSASMARDIDPAPRSFSHSGMEYNKGELSPTGIDRGWPHQVALPAAVLLNGGYKVVHAFCDDLSLCPRGHTVFIMTNGGTSIASRRRARGEVHGAVRRRVVRSKVKGQR
jgi:hypothetical protein